MMSAEVTASQYITYDMFVHWFGLHTVTQVVLIPTWGTTGARGAVGGVQAEYGHFGGGRRET